MRIFIVLFIIVLVILFYKIAEFHASQIFVDGSLPFYAQDKWTNKIIYAESPKDIAAHMISSEEGFRGDLTLDYLNSDAATIHIRNYAIGDDSIGAYEYYVHAERKPKGWQVTQYKTHWKCARGLIWPNFWSTSSCP